MSQTPLFDLAVAFDLPNAFAFLPHRRLLSVEGQDVTTNLLTLCNCAVSALTAARGCAVPGLKANQQNAWFKNEGRALGWLQVNKEAAIRFVKTGHTVIASWVNPTNGPGHTGMGVEPPPGAPDDVFYVTSAGRKNYVRTTLANSFGPNIEDEVEFFVYKPRP